MTPEQLNERRGQVTALLNALPAAWSLLAAELRQRRADLLERLVAADDPELRGAIKEIDQILQLPNNLQQELLSFVNALPDEGADTDV
jgi:hypothetical protein